ncbi:MAG: cupin domain-containing protein [Cyanobacteria bacterium P01_D01_bin.105]
MLVRKLHDCEEFVAGDSTMLREMLHPDKQAIALRYSLAHATLPIGEISDPHALKTSEVYYILSGKGEMHIDDEVQMVDPGDTVYIPPMARQYIRSCGDVPLMFLAIVDPAWKVEDEIVYTEK